MKKIIKYILLILTALAFIVTPFIFVNSFFSGHYKAKADSVPDSLSISNSEEIEKILLWDTYVTLFDESTDEYVVANNDLLVNAGIVLNGGRFFETSIHNHIAHAGGNVRLEGPFSLKVVCPTNYRAAVLWSGGEGGSNGSSIILFDDTNECTVNYDEGWCLSGISFYRSSPELAFEKEKLGFNFGSNSYDGNLDLKEIYEKYYSGQSAGCSAKMFDGQSPDEAGLLDDNSYYSSGYIDGYNNVRSYFDNIDNSHKNIKFIMVMPSSFVGDNAVPKRYAIDSYCNYSSDFNNLVVKAVFDDNSERILNDDEFEISMSNVSFFNAGNYDVVITETISSKRLTTTYSVEIYDYIVSINSRPKVEEMIYDIGDSFKCDNLIVKALWKSGKYEKLSSDKYIVNSENFDNTKAGTYIINVEEKLAENSKKEPVIDSYIVSVADNSGSGESNTSVNGSTPNSSGQGKTSIKKLGLDLGGLLGSFIFIIIVLSLVYIYTKTRRKK